MLAHRTVGCQSGIREPVVAGPGPTGRVPRRGHPRRRACAADGVRAVVASSYFSVITPQGGSQNVIFVGSCHLTQRELYRLGLLVTLFFLVVFLVAGTAWILLITG
jgi:hypothetical protein